MRFGLANFAREDANFSREDAKKKDARHSVLAI
jgi:hypothetical protein